MESAQIEVLCNDLGRLGAEDVICRATEDLGQRLFEIQDLARRGPREDLYKALRAVGAVAEQIGLAGLAQVAQDVRLCIDRGDPVGEAATLARLARSGESSLSELWSLQDLSL